MKKRLTNIWLSSGLVVSIIIAGFTLPVHSNEDDKQKTELGIKGAGTENRAWVTRKESLSSKTYKVKVQENVEIQVSDGTIIRGRLLLPEGIKNPLPTIVQLNGYGHESLQNSSKGMLVDLAERGYAVLHVSMSGTGTSEGDSGLYKYYMEDGYDVIEWAAAQPWSNGNVGTVGLSLNGISQWLAAKELPPSLKAISPVVACANCYNALWHPGGMESGPGRIARGYEYEVAKDHRNYDEWWQERSISTEELEAIAENGIAAFISGGWNDYISPGNIKAYEIYSAVGGASKLIVSQGAHGYLDGILPLEFKDYQALWFDHYLRSVDNGVVERDPVLIYVQGANQWRYEKSWPLEDTNSVDLFFSDQKSKSIDSINDGSLVAKVPTKKHSSVGYSYSPADGPFLPSLLSSSGRLPINQQPYEEETATWTTDALAVPTEVTGNMSATFWAEVDAVDADFVVQVTDVAPDGTSKQVVAGYLNASRTESQTKPTPLTPGEVKEFTVEILPTSYVFKKGHRIRISIAGGAKALEGQQAPQGPGLNPTPSDVEIYQDAAHPSSFKLPLIGVNSLITTKSNQKAIENASDNVLVGAEK
ncbi:X-Pro dipeptidyl-peptidase (S15 family) [Planococcus glaciei]|uniref:CocE/NonD family hydrolase n=1 Tax=Planococcus glaciei TaxID=459472 RepID=UPI000882D55C|nr:CocE/NonD family hydrolase [Planococcus glaciei]SDI35820.1 X-Pro dipeptidyl-peptidase (S15 family) [Planococcus glaciei]